MADASPRRDTKDRRRRKGRLKRAVAKTAPQIAHTLGGPLAGAAVEALSRAIFGEDAVKSDPMADEALVHAVENATTDQIAAIRKADQSFRLALQRANLDAMRIAAGDRADARARQIAMEDATPAILGGLIITGFFVVLGVMVARRLPVGAETEFSIMLGALATMTAAVVNYYFGSSAGSREKTRLLTPDASMAVGDAKARGFGWDEDRLSASDSDDLDEGVR
ncbi:MAG: hypothetical protein AAF224_09800 [Pseudomonadota bacterium]